MNVFATEHPLAAKPLSRRTGIIAAMIALVMAVAAALFLWHIDGPRIVARATATDGTEFCVVQKCNWNLEFFTTTCYYRKPGGRWGWFYYDHEDWYWRRVGVEVSVRRQHQSGFDA